MSTMADATSPFLNISLRSESQARADRAREQARVERLRRLQEHGAAFRRIVLDGAFERVPRPDGGYRLRDVRSGLWLDEAATNPIIRSTGTPRPDSSRSTPLMAPSEPPPGSTAQRSRSSYGAALRDLSCWISLATTKPHMDPDTLAAVNREIARLLCDADRDTARPP